MAVLARRTPLALVSLRALLGPLLLGAALYRPDEMLFALCIGAAFLSDYFDGVIARRLGVATSGLRRLDSIADTCFYACAGFAAYAVAPELLTPYTGPLVVLVVAELARYAVDLAKFGKEASYHMWSSKAWGVLLFLATFSVLVLHRSGGLVFAAILWGIMADIEGLAISLTLDEWRADVPTWWHARRYKRRAALARGAMLPADEQVGER